ncbi:copper chaperone PCu(A)C [Actinomadura sp. ATCC 31491]|uniref:Copper chaperone PCu(A)C n=1 Tax=Actinomadura luzonensis TaxID=2805427 RepID=A0ABT0G1U2_9ACTN|nr:copper chaperone PCu(A)C [Actinomadura luzonensis]MCK2218558.1 copper chaperone PCu(A)C [Actinomadura luzonensis]
MRTSSWTAGALLRLLLAGCLLATVSACNPGERQSPVPRSTRNREGLVDGHAGPVRLLHVQILAPPMDEQKAGDDLGLYLTLVNDSDQAQRLEGVSTAHAARVVYRATPSAQRQAVAVPIPAGATLSMQQGQNRPHLELVDIVRPLGATPIDVTFRLTTGTTTLRVPVLPLSRGAEPPTPSPS